MIKSEFGKVEIKAKSTRDLLIDLTLCINGVIDTLKEHGYSDAQIKKDINDAVKHAFMSEKEFCEEFFGNYDGIGSAIKNLADEFLKDIAKKLEEISEKQKEKEE